MTIIRTPGFTANSALCPPVLAYRAVASAVTDQIQFVSPAFPWLRCLGGCWDCLGGDAVSCGFCRNCGICLLGLRDCPSEWNKL
jgi:hypothetical protein